MDYYSLSKEYIEYVFEMDRTASSMRKLKCAGDIMHGEMMILAFLRNRGESVGPGELSREAEISTARVAAALNSLEKKGLITRTPSEDDRRRLWVSLTDAGRKYVDKKREGMIEYHAMMLESLGETDSRELVRILGRLAENGKTILKETQEKEAK